MRHAWVTEQIQAVHLASRGTYGSRRVHAELRLGLGITIGHGAVELLMHRAGIKGLPGNRRPRHQTPTAGDLVRRQFTRPLPDQLWVTDITEHPTREGKVYCAVVLDACTRRVAGWSIEFRADPRAQGRGPGAGVTACGRGYGPPRVGRCRSRTAGPTPRPAPRI